MFMCGLADSEERNKNSPDYDPLTYFKCMLLLNSNYVGKVDYDDDDDYEYSGDYDYSGSGDYDYDYKYDYLSDYGYEYSSGDSVDYNDDYDDSGDYSYYYYDNYDDGSDNGKPALYVYESDVRDYYQLATEICYLGKVLKLIDWFIV